MYFTIVKNNECMLCMAKWHNATFQFGVMTCNLLMLCTENSTYLSKFTLDMCGYHKLLYTNHYNYKIVRFHSLIIIAYILSECRLHTPYVPHRVDMVQVRKWNNMTVYVLR